MNFMDKLVRIDLVIMRLGEIFAAQRVAFDVIGLGQPEQEVGIAARRSAG